jgi:hypothetical protein
VFGLFDIVAQEYDYLADVVFGLFDIVVQEYDYLADVVFGLFEIVVQAYANSHIPVLQYQITQHNILQIVIFIYYNIK